MKERLKYEESTEKEFISFILNKTALTKVCEAE
jgi:hypothetical protein